MRSRYDSLALVFTFFFFFIACKDKDKDPGNFVRIDEVDPAMTAAVEKAKATRTEFAQAFNERKPGTKGFYVKKPFPAPGAGGRPGAEHIWLEVQELDGETVKGRVANQPQDTKAVRFGETVSLQLSEISDWKYQDGEKLMGGYSIRYFVDKMSPAEREAFFNQNGFRF